MQRKVFRIEQTLGKRQAKAAVGVDQRRAIDGLKTLQVQSPPSPIPKHELESMQATLAQHRRDLATLMVDGKQRRMARASGELGAAIEGMEKGAERILKSAEGIDDNAKALFASLKSDYERGLAQDIQDHIVRIYEACNFQDLSGQRIGNVIATLNALEDQLGHMLARCDGVELPENPAAPKRGDGLLNGPRLDGDTGHITQSDIDAMFG